MRDEQLKEKMAGGHTVSICCSGSVAFKVAREARYHDRQIMAHDSGVLLSRNIAQGTWSTAATTMIALLYRSRLLTSTKWFEYKRPSRSSGECMHDGGTAVGGARQPSDKAGTFLACAVKYAGSVLSKTRWWLDQSAIRARR